MREYGGKGMHAGLGALQYGGGRHTDDKETQCYIPQMGRAQGRRGRWAKEIRGWSVEDEAPVAMDETKREGTASNTTWTKKTLRKR